MDKIKMKVICSGKVGTIKVRDLKSMLHPRFVDKKPYVLYNAKKPYAFVNKLLDKDRQRLHELKVIFLVDPPRTKKEITLLRKEMQCLQERVDHLEQFNVDTFYKPTNKTK